METRVESTVESSPDPSDPAPPGGTLQLRLLGPLTVRRGAQALVLPPSRKVRALLAVLALAPQGVPRSRLVELLWDGPDDPRGELRWCLSKLRALLDAPGRPVLLSEGESVRLALPADAIDARALLNAAAPTDIVGWRQRAAALDGEFLQDLAIERSAPFSAWLLGQRRRFRELHAAALEALARALPEGDDEAVGALERWLEISPFERRAHLALFAALAARGRLREGDEHLAAAARAFEAESQDWAPLGRAWAAAKASRGRALPPVLPASVADGQLSGTPAALRRASIAVMPFADPDRRAESRGGLADGLVHDVITRLAKLRSLFVIAQGTVFALDERRIDADEAGRALDVDYLASGTLHREPGRVLVEVRLVEARSSRVLWADRFASPLQDTFALLEEIGNRIVASVAQQIEVAERNRAVLLPPGSLDAWAAHHRGLWHMVRFNRADNEQAHHYFALSARLDPTFARPQAGLSFTHFQNAFLGWGERAQEVEAAYRCAALGLLADERDPAAHWAMGRALWLRGSLDAALGELETSVELSPNFALGHYTLGFVRAQSGDPRAAIRACDQSRDLSPFDPLLFAMLAARALALMRMGRHDEAADWAARAIARPNAHVHVQCIGAHCLALAGRLDEARQVAASIRAARPDYRLDDFLASFRLGEDALSLTHQAAARIGLDL